MKIHDVATWINKRDDWTSARDLVNKYKIQYSSAGRMLSLIEQSEHYETQMKYVKPARGAPAKHIKVNQIISKPRGSGRKAVPIRATCMRTGTVIDFEGTMAAVKEGFTRSLVQKCLSGEAHHHAGYTWERIKKDEQGDANGNSNQQ